MKITLISVGISTDAIGPRVLSSLLKQNGYKTQLIFLSTMEDIKRRATKKAFYYTEKILDKIVALSKKSDLIGISLMTHHYSTVKDLTQRLKKELATPIIWGGIHPTVCPTECLDTADFVCVGEAETSLIKLAEQIEQRKDPIDIQGIWTKRNGIVIDNGSGPMAKDLDSLPFPDYSFEDHHLLVEDEIQIMTKWNWYKHLLQFFPPLNSSNPDNPAYQILSARGCPFNCAFCGEGPLMRKSIYGRHYFRKRSVQNIINELKWVKERFPFIGEICFCDDTFPSRTIEEINDFVNQYKRKIDLPFYILVSPANVTKQKFDLLVDAGLKHVGMGIQSGSKRIIKLYNREKVGSVNQSLKAAKILNSYKDRLLPYYDFIIENPYETREDLIDSIRLLSKLPRPYQVRVYALSFFPGTDLNRKAHSDGLLHSDSFDKTFGQRTEGGYLSFIIDLTKYEILRPMLRIFISKPLIYLFCRPLFDRLIRHFQNFNKLLAVKLQLHKWGLS